MDAAFAASKSNIGWNLYSQRSMATLECKGVRGEKWLDEVERKGGAFIFAMCDWVKINADASNVAVPK
jgi:hypothetical protein